VITDSWARCRFGVADGGGGDGGGGGGAKGVAVQDRASGQTMAEYSPASGLEADTLGLLRPAEAP